MLQTPQYSERAPTRAQADAITAKLLLTPEGRRDPYPLYDQLRRAAPVHRTGLGPWVLSRYDDCVAALRDPRIGKDMHKLSALRFGPDWRRHVVLDEGRRAMHNLTGRDHARLRGLVAKGFTPRMITDLQPYIEDTIAEMLEPIAEAGGGDILAALAFPLPVMVIGKMLGVPEADRARFRGPVLSLVTMFEMMPTKQQLEAANAAHVEVRSYFLELVAEKRRRPREDLLSALTRVEVEGERLDDLELATLAQLLFAAGFETTTNAIANGLLALLRAPDQLQLLREDRRLLAELPAELVRYDSPAQMAVRVTEEELVIGGETIPADAILFILLGAGNRDPARFERPNSLDVTRTGVRPLSFGGGVHHCLGASLARIELSSTFAALLDRFGHIELDGPAPQVRDLFTLRGLSSLKVSTTAASGPRAKASGVAQRGG